ncbi:hypothetical protein FHG87_012451 [Trinorchestia longiramus]|nr:hypothetical protein FHG87_012451 [Trinorchestia longiramus]
MGTWGSSWAPGPLKPNCRARKNTKYRGKHRIRNQRSDEHSTPLKKRTIKSTRVTTTTKTTKTARTVRAAKTARTAIAATATSSTTTSTTTTETTTSGIRPTRVEGSQHNASAVRAGEEVWVKPPNANCTTQWGRGVVTGVTSSNNIEVDGVPRHVLDVRSVVPPLPRDEEARDERGGGLSSVQEKQMKVEQSEGENEPQQMKRDKRPPAWITDYITV